MESFGVQGNCWVQTELGCGGYGDHHLDDGARSRTKREARSISYISSKSNRTSTHRRSWLGGGGGSCALFRPQLHAVDEPGPLHFRVTKLLSELPATPAESDRESKAATKSTRVGTHKAS